MIGLVEAIIQFNFLDQPGLTDVLLLVVALIAVWLQSRSGGEGESAFSFTPPVETIPARLKAKFWVRNLDRGVLLVLLAAVVAVPIFITQPSRLLLYATIAAFAICALSLTVLTGWAGQLSLGQMAFAGIGALTAAALTRGLAIHWVLGGVTLINFELYGLPFVVSILIGALFTALLSAIIGVGALRVRGLLLAVTTFAFAIAAPAWVYGLDVFSNGKASSVDFPRGDLFGLDLQSQRTYFYVVLAVLVLVMAVLGRLRRNGVGRTTLAVRDNADAAASYTVRPSLAKLRAFALAGFIAGLGGGLLAGAVQGISFSDSPFVVTVSLSLVAIIVIGGMGSTAGAVIGAVWVIGLPAFFPDSTIIPLLSSSVGLLVLLLYFPGGLIQIAYNVRSRLYHWLEARLPPVEAVTSASRRPPSVAPSEPAAEHEVALEVTAVSVAFGGVKANDQVSIDVRNGEIVGLIGTNGAGKTTLMNALGGFVGSTGKVELLGEEISGQVRPRSAPAAGLGRTFQAATLFPELTVRETVEVALEARGRTSLLKTALFFPGAVRREHVEALRRGRPDRLPRSRPLRRQAHLRPVHRHPAHRRAGRPARPRRPRALPRRADRRHRPARDRGDGDAARRGAPRARRVDADHRTRHAAHHEHERSRLLPRARPGHRRRRTRPRAQRPRRHRQLPRHRRADHDAHHGDGTAPKADAAPA